MQKGGISAPCEMQQGHFSKKFFEKKYRSIPIGRMPRLERGGCRFESCLLYNTLALAYR